MWTSRQRVVIIQLSGIGLSPGEIAVAVGLSENQLRQAFDYEIRVGPIWAKARVAGALFTACQQGNITAIKFWLEHRSGWARASSDHSHVADAERAVEPEVRDVIRMLDREGRDALRLVLRQLEPKSAIPREQA